LTLDYFKFPTGEMHYKNLPFRGVVHVPYDRKHTINDHLMLLLLAGNENHSLFIPYLPYSRQDRPMEGQPFSLKTVGRMINSVGFTSVLTLDVHSDVAFGCIDRLRVIPVNKIFDVFFYPDIYATTLVVPDQGASKRLKDLSGRFGDVVTCIKERDTSTGRVEIKHVAGSVINKNCLIVDDICDGGATFIQIAQDLKKRGASNIDLFVTHGVFTKGLQVLLDAGIRKVYTTDSFSQESHPQLKVISCQKILEDYLNA
jgi:ribose-phosphate pyrophosphokinase